MYDETRNAVLVGEILSHPEHFRAWLVRQGPATLRDVSACAGCFLHSYLTSLLPQDTAVWVSFPELYTGPAEPLPLFWEDMRVMGWQEHPIPLWADAFQRRSMGAAESVGLDADTDPEHEALVLFSFQALAILDGVLAGS